MATPDHLAAEAIAKPKSKGRRKSSEGGVSATQLQECIEELTKQKEEAAALVSETKGKMVWRPWSRR